MHVIPRIPVNEEGEWVPLRFETSDNTLMLTDNILLNRGLSPMARR
jgi:hypothetical protein